MCNFTQEVRKNYKSLYHINIILQISNKPHAQSIELHKDEALNDKLTFTKSKIRSDEQLLLEKQGLWL